LTPPPLQHRQQRAPREGIRRREAGGAEISVAHIFAECASVPPQGRSVGRRGGIASDAEERVSDAEGEAGNSQERRMDSHAQRGLDEQRALCAVEHARVEAERRSAAPLVAARNTVDAFDVIQRVGRRARTWRPLGQFYGCMGAAFEVKPRGEHGPLLVLKVVLNDPTHGGAARSEADVLEKFRAEIEFTGDPGRLPPHRNLAYCYRYFVAAARGLPDLDWMDEYTECQTLCVVMEHINGTTLQTLAGQQQQQHAAGGGAAGGGAASLFPEAVLLSYSEQLLRAIAHLKDHAIVHRDIKPDNVMVSGAFRQFLKVRATRATAHLSGQKTDRHRQTQVDISTDSQTARQAHR
jgi:hypothetical protein